MSSINCLEPSVLAELHKDALQTLTDAIKAGDLTASLWLLDEMRPVTITDPHAVGYIAHPSELGVGATRAPGWGSNGVPTNPKPPAMPKYKPPKPETCPRCTSWLAFFRGCRHG